MKLDSFSHFEDPLGALELPRFGENANIVFALEIVFDQRLDNVLPLTVNRAGAVVIRMDRVRHARMKDRHTIARSREPFAGNIRTHRRANAEDGALLEEIPPADSRLFF